MIGGKLHILLVCGSLALAATTASVAARTPPAAPAQASITPDAATAAPESRILELQAHRRSGVVSAWLANGVRVHHRGMSEPAGQVEIIISFAGGELLECPETRGLTLLAAAYLDRPVSGRFPAPGIDDALADRDAHIEGGVNSDSLQVRVWGSRDDVEPALAIVCAGLLRPVIDGAQLAEYREHACDLVERVQGDQRWIVTETLLELVAPRGDCRSKLACTKRMSGYDAATLQAWVRRHGESAPCEIAIVGDIDMPAALRLAAATLGELPERARPARYALATDRKVARRCGPFANDVKCDPAQDVDHAHVLAGFLAPDPSEILEVRRLRAGARVLAERLEARLRGLKFGDQPRVAAQYVPSAFSGLSMTVVSARVLPGDAEAVRQMMQASMCELLDDGLSQSELSKATDALAHIAAAYERDPRYWAAILSRSSLNGMDPDQVADGAGAYRAMTPDQIMQSMRRACTLENRVGLVVRPGP